MKITFEQSQQLVKVLAILVELDIISMEIFASASVDIGEITAIGNSNYLLMVISVLNKE